MPQNISPKVLININGEKALGSTVDDYKPFYPPDFLDTDFNEDFRIETEAFRD